MPKEIEWVGGSLHLIEKTIFEMISKNRQSWREIYYMRKGKDEKQGMIP